jgi:hypothetical protein
MYHHQQVVGLGWIWNGWRSERRGLIGGVRYLA